MNYVIDFLFDKAAKWPIRMDSTGQEIYHGYNRRPAGTALGGIIVHSTNGHAGSSFLAEAEYLRDSPNVSAHYLIGHAGEITRILDPLWRAWHAGQSSWLGCGDCNNWTVGIEWHHAVGEPWPAAQLDAGAWLCRELMRDHPTITKLGIAAHRWVATPPGRKTDPAGLSDQFLHHWIAAL
jgi:AmpD protein